MDRVATEEPSSKTNIDVLQRQAKITAVETCQVVTHTLKRGSFNKRRGTGIKASRKGCALEERSNDNVCFARLMAT